MNQARFRFFLLYSFVPLAAGTLIYLLWRADSLLAFRWLGMIHMSGPVDVARSVVGGWAPHFPDWFLYSLPDGLWVFAATNAMAVIWLHGRHPEAWGWVLLPAILAFLSEAGQYTNHVPGTFCVEDIIAYVVGTALALFLIRIHWTEREKGYAA